MQHIAPHELKPLRTSIRNCLLKSRPANDSAYSAMSTSTSASSSTMSLVEFGESTSAAESNADSNFDIVALEKKEISSSNVIIGKVLGEGASGTVFIGEYQGKKVAVKTLTITEQQIKRLQNYSDKDINEKLDSLIHEKNMLETISLVNHNDENANCIVSYYGSYSEKIVGKMGNIEIPYLVLEFANSSTLEALIADKIYPPEWNILYPVAGDIARGLYYLHYIVGIVHCDLKPANILLNKNDEGILSGKICDFGISKFKDSEDKGGGTRAYFAPEIGTEGAEHSVVTEMYSFGIVLWEMAARQTINEKLSGNILDYVCSGNYLDIPMNTPEKISCCMKLFWNRDVKKRGTSQDATNYFQTDIETIAPSLRARTNY